MNNYPSLFRSDSHDWHNNACLNFMPDMSYGYIEGYLRAGDILVDYVNEQASGQDVLVYPIIFCYRHHLELRMKEIIKLGRNLLDGKGDYDDNHQLTVLWRDCRTIVLRVWAENEAPGELPLIDHFITELDRADSKSDGFRYWESTKRSGRTPNLEGIGHINIRHFRDCMKAMTDFLGSAALGISVYLEQSREVI